MHDQTPMASSGHIMPEGITDEAARRVLGQRIAAGLCTTGSITSYVGAFTLQMSAGAQAVQLATAVVFTVLGITLAATKPHAVVTQAALLWAILAISLMLATADSYGTTPFFYLWPVVFAAYFCTTRFLVGALSFQTATLLGALFVSKLDWAVKVDTFIGVTLSVGIVAAVVSLMHRREERLNRQLAEAAHTDPLTGLLNRRGFDPQFEQMIAENVARDRAVSVVMFDLDRFKLFNDQHGHLVGDDALRRMATVLDSHCRDVDLVARLGGEEFAVVLPGATAADARSYAERVAWGLGTEDVDASLRITTSSGIGSVETGADAFSISSLLLRADEALYAAKAGGRARAAWWSGHGIEIGDEIDVPEPVAAHIVSPPERPREYKTRRIELEDREGLRNSA